MVTNLTNAKECTVPSISVAKINDFFGSNRYYDGNRKNGEVQTVSIIHVHGSKLWILICVQLII
jgi:hypothetical protein